MLDEAHIRRRTVVMFDHLLKAERILRDLRADLVTGGLAGAVGVCDEALTANIHAQNVAADAELAAVEHVAIAASPDKAP